jgi:Spy/CpxP family protein refolding chaperone
MNIKFPSRKNLMGTGLVLVLLAMATGAINNQKALAQAAGESLSDSGLEDAEFQKACVKHGLKRFFQNIGASDEQKTKITSLVERKFTANKEARQKLRAGFKEILSLAQDDSISNEEIKSRVESLKTMHNQMTSDRLDTLLQIRGMLDKEQKAKLGKPRICLSSRMLQK